MIIAVNTRLLIKNKLEGIGRFSFETLKRITIQHPEHQFLFIFDRPFDEEFIFSSNITPVVTGLPARHPVLFYLWLEHSVSSLLAKKKADIFLSPDGYLSLSTGIKSVPVIHDLNFEHRPQDLPFLMSKYYRYYFPKFAQKAERIATVSSFSKTDIAKRYGIEENKIDVVFNGASEVFQPISEEEKILTRKKYSGGQDFFIFIGSIHPRKNLSNLFKAFEMFKKSSSSPAKLLITGDKYYWTAAMSDALNNMTYKEDVVFTGRMEDEELSKVLASALALTYVSFFEGFGIPLIEAMNCEVPVITSKNSSLPEVAGDAALFVDPFSEESIANAMAAVHRDEVLRKFLIEKGKIRKDNFSWQKTSELLWNSVEKTIG